MILPSDSDPPPERNDGENPASQPEEDNNWWTDSGDEESDSDPPSLPDDLDALPDDLDDPNAPELQSVAGPGWRNDLYKDLIESLRDLEAIEDPDDEFAPPEPPDLYTFFGELAALRHEFRHDGLRTQQALAKLAQTLPAGAAPTAGIRRKGKSGSEPLAAAEPWSIENCLALISAYDLLPKASSPAAFEDSFRPLLQAAGLAKIPALGKSFDSKTMTRIGTEPATKKAPPGTVVYESLSGFLRAGVLLRPASVIVSS